MSCIEMPPRPIPNNFDPVESLHKMLQNRKTLFSQYLMKMVVGVADTRSLSLQDKKIIQNETVKKIPVCKEKRQKARRNMDAHHK